MHVPPSFCAESWLDRWGQRKKVGGNCAKLTLLVYFPRASFVSRCIRRVECQITFFLCFFRHRKLQRTCKVLLRRCSGSSAWESSKTFFFFFHCVPRNECSRRTIQTFISKSKKRGTGASLAILCHQVLFYPCSRWHVSADDFADYRNESMTSPLPCFASTNSWFVTKNDQKAQQGKQMRVGTVQRLYNAFH